MKFRHIVVTALAFGVIVVIVAVVRPGLVRAPTTSYEIPCANNLKSLYVFAVTYADKRDRYSATGDLQNDVLHDSRQPPQKRLFSPPLKLLDSPIASQECLLKHIANVDILHLVIPQSMGDQCLDPLAVEVDKLFECLPIS